MLLARCNPTSRVIAIEKSTSRLPRLQQNLQRMQLENVCVQQADALALPFADNSIDAILLDAPCTASGVLRKHPDAKFLHHQHDVIRHAILQKNMLQEALRVLKPRGHLVYAVCSIHPQENEQVVEGMPGLQSMRRLLPDAQHDGFFVAHVQKQK